jgi:membrane-associated phospholipid phosphatase
VVPLYGVAVCAGLFGLLLVLAYTSARARHFDASALQGFVDLPRGGRGETLAMRVASLGDAGSVALIALLLAGVALLRGRPRIAVAVLLLVAATSVSSQLLKALLSYPREPALVGANAFPSGHSTAAMTLAFCGVLVAPARLRPLAALAGLAFALGVAFGVVALSWHFPSDVIGGYLLATGWTLAVVSGLLWLEQRRPERPGQVTIAVRAAVDRVAAVGLVSAVVAGAALVALAVVVVLVTRRPDLGGFVQEHTAAVVMAPLIVAAGAALLAAVTALLKRDQ